MYEIMICPIKQLYVLAEDGDMSDVAVLAVSSYDINRKKLSAFKHKMCLNFNDVTNSFDNNAFTTDTAAQIAEFVKALPNNLDTLFVCCDGGESRSTAMAAAIMRAVGMDEMKIWKNPHYHPNTLVYSLLCEALGISVSRVELQTKEMINEKAFSDAIKHN